MGKLASAEIARLRGQFAPRLSASGGSTGLEAVERGGTAELSPPAIVERWRISQAFLFDFIRKELAGDPELVGLAERTLKDGREGLELIGGHRDSSEAGMGRLHAGLEVIVRTDGSRPAFIVRGDDIVETSSPPGTWTSLLTDVTRLPGIRRVLGSVGRVDIVHALIPFAGTAWLIADDLVVTNRHVAQLFVDFDAGGGPQLMPGRDAHVDFGHELNGTASRSRRPVTELVFCGAKRIPEFGLDHSLLDMAVFRLAPSAEPGPQQAPLAIGLGEQLSSPQTQVVIVGYPAKPSDTALGSVTETDKVLKLLFNKLWGYKRLAPGEIMPGAGTKRTLSHDASTLGGNSGSMVMGIDSVPLVTGLHYGGQWDGDRANFGHVVENVLDEQGLAGLRHATLRDLCKAEGVGLVSPA